MRRARASPHGIFCLGVEYSPEPSARIFTTTPEPSSAWDASKTAMVVASTHIPFMVSVIFLLYTTIVHHCRTMRPGWVHGASLFASVRSRFMWKTNIEVTTFFLFDVICEYFLRQMLLLNDGFGGFSYRTDFCVCVV